MRPPDSPGENDLIPTLNLRTGDPSLFDDQINQLLPKNAHVIARVVDPKVNPTLISDARGAAPQLEDFIPGLKLLKETIQHSQPVRCPLK